MLPQAQLQELLQAQQILQVLPQALKVRPLPVLLRVLLQPPPLLPVLLRVLLPALWRVLLTLLLQAQLLLLQALLTLQPVLLQARKLLLTVLPQAQLSLLPALPPLLILLLQGPALRRIPRHLPRSQQKPQGFRRIPAQKP